MVVKKEVEIGGRMLSLETGKLAKQADGAVMVRMGDTMVLATVVAKKEANVGQDFFPLQVEYREKTSSIGKIPGGFFKREGKPSEKEVLSARLIDRPLRPMFPESFKCETQVIVTVFSSDRELDADVLGAVAASAALTISDIPFDGPIAEVRVGRVDGQFVVNPTYTQLQLSDIDLTVAGTNTSILMVEGSSKEVSEADMLAALKFAHGFIQILCAIQVELRNECGKAKRVIDEKPPYQAWSDLVSSIARPGIAKIARTPLAKEERSQANADIRTSTFASLTEKVPSAGLPLTDTEKAHLQISAEEFVQSKSAIIDEFLHTIEYEEMRKMILDEGKRLDGRGLRDIRKITCEIGLLPRTHGSALFTRGETQSLTTATLGTKLDEQMLEGLLPDTTKKFMLHYNFPPFSVGEVGRLGFVGRREIGHGALAERSLKIVLPEEKDFPYTIRIVSDILESNGSSSMATVCAGTLSLMDAGVPILRPVAGIAMGLIKEGEKTAILSDILGNEDHLGDMDFKVAGTRDGITGFQMDIKIQGISFAIFEEALAQAKEGRLKILEIMAETIATARPELSLYAPRLTTIKIPIDMIGALIGPGGKNIRQITADTDTEINIEDDGTVVIAAVNGECAAKALALINRIVEIPEVGKVYQGKVTRCMEFGAFVEFLPGKEGLVHISQLDLNRVNKVTDAFNVGDPIEVKLMEKDSEGRYNLSRKATLPGYDPSKEPPKQERRSSDRGGDRGGRRDGGHRGGGDRGHRDGGGNR